MNPALFRACGRIRAAPETVRRDRATRRRGISRVASNRASARTARSAAGLTLRHDHGSNYMAEDFQREIAFLGIAPPTRFGPINTRKPAPSPNWLWQHKEYYAVSNFRASVHAAQG